MKPQKTISLFFTICFAAACFAQSHNLEFASWRNNDYNDYITDNDTVITSIRKISINDYKDDTLKAFFNYNWTPGYPGNATYFSFVFPYGKYWHCIDYYVKENQEMRNGFFSDKALTVPEGPFKYHYKNGQVAIEGNYKDGLKTGNWTRYDAAGNVIEYMHFRNNIPIGTAYAVNNKDTAFTVLDTLGNGAGYFYKKTAEGKKLYGGKFSKGLVRDSIWVQYDENNKIWYTQQYEGGRQINETCYDTNGNVMDTCVTKMAEYKKGTKSVLNYLANSVSFPDRLRLTMPSGRVIVEFMIDEDGHIGDIRILQSLHPKFDEQVIYALQKMHKWKPAIDHNRPVKAYYRLPVTFKNQ